VRVAVVHTFAGRRETRAPVPVVAPERVSRGSLSGVHELAPSRYRNCNPGGPALDYLASADLVSPSRVLIERSATSRQSLRPGRWPAAALAPNQPDPEWSARRVAGLSPAPRCRDRPSSEPAGSDENRSRLKGPAASVSTRWVVRRDEKNGDCGTTFEPPGVVEAWGASPLRRASPITAARPSLGSPSRPPNEFGGSRLSSGMPSGECRFGACARRPHGRWRLGCVGVSALRLSLQRCWRCRERLSPRLGPCHPERLCSGMPGRPLAASSTTTV
jgi:hypothetical protein